MTNSYKRDYTLNEKDSLIDMLNLEKEMVKTYSTAMTEGTSRGFRTLIKSHWNETVKDQFDVFSYLTEHGYAKVEPSDKQKIEQEKVKFNKEKQTIKA